MDQYTTKEEVLKLGILDPELEEVRTTHTSHYTESNIRTSYSKKLHTEPSIPISTQ